LGRRLLGWSLVLHGLVGLGIVLGGAVVGLDVAARVERLASAAGGTLDAAARSTEAASDAFTNVDASLAESQVSAERAADLALEASGTLDSLSRAMELSVFGAQPLLPLASEFAASADQAASLAETLDSVAASLDETRGDVSGIGVELDRLASQLAVLQESTGSGGGAPPIRPFVILLLAWLLVPAVGGVIGGLAVLRLARAPAAAP
jgi:hypothetical protein